MTFFSLGKLINLHDNLSTKISFEIFTCFCAVALAVSIFSEVLNTADLLVKTEWKMDLCFFNFSGKSYQE